VDTSEESSLEPEQFDFLKNKHLLEVVSGQQDVLACVEEVVTKKTGKLIVVEDKEDDEMPAMPIFNPTVNYYELYWEMYLRNESLMA